MLPLESTTVIDFSRLLPGPLATLMLAQMGAKVVRVEHPERTDLARLQPPFVEGQSTLFAMLNEGKQSTSINYTTREGYEQVLELIAEADVLVEQFRPGVMQQWQLDHETLQRINPRLIYVSLTGYGQTGPRAGQAGHDINYLALSGMLDLNRDAEGHPVVPGVQIADIGGGSYLCALAVVSALLKRTHTKVGSYIDVAMLDGMLPLMTIPFSQEQGGLRARSADFLRGGLVNYNVYRTADGRWMALGALEIKFWNNFCELVDRPQWKRTNPMELSVHVFPKGDLEELFREKTQKEWIDLATRQDICLSPVRTAAEVLADPCFLRKQSLNTLSITDQAELMQVGLPFTFKKP